MVPSLTQRPARRSRVLAVVGGLTLALAVVVFGALASHDGGSAATVTRAAGPVEGVAPVGAHAAPVALQSGPALVPPAGATPQRVYEDWQINEMNARHPEP